MGYKSLPLAIHYVTDVLVYVCEEGGGGGNRYCCHHGSTPKKGVGKIEQRRNRLEMGERKPKRKIPRRGKGNSYENIE